MVWHLDEPYGGGLPSWYVFQFMSQDVKVGLTRSGGDELFGNYGKFYPMEKRGLARSRQAASKVIGWEKNFRNTLSMILNYQKNNDVEFVTISFSPNVFLTLEEKSLKTIFLGFNPEIIETQLKIIRDMKNQITEKSILEKIDNINLIDPNNPKIKVFKP